MSPKPPVEMPCATYATMCKSCRNHFEIMLESGNPAETLELPPDSYPIVFKSMFQLPAGPNADARAEKYSPGTFLPIIQARLAARFSKIVPAYYDHEVLQPEIGGPKLVRISLLVDFPVEDTGFGGLRGLLRNVIVLRRDLEDWTTGIEVEEGLKEALFRGLGTGPHNWEAFVASQQDHLCASRLGWFLKREGMVPYF
ncbi:hypothetical protein BJY04DRAFT_219160 [Aspergillus karnatakaensis]|uniref:uncharacterized protein n=1 Tax=Aspergillus karnatakaensis TaxID=1810916 RepID=UPI003CCE2497